MSEILYQASPSMVRMKPFGTFLVMLLILAGVVLLVGGQPLLSAQGLPDGNGQIMRLVAIAVIVLGLLRLFSWWLSTKFDRLVIKSNEIVWTHGLLTKQYTEVSMSSVRTVRVSQSILQRIMNAGDVAIYTAGDAPELVIKGLPNPEAIREHIGSDS